MWPNLCVLRPGATMSSIRLGARNPLGSVNFSLSPHGHVPYPSSVAARVLRPTVRAEHSNLGKKECEEEGGATFSMRNYLERISRTGVTTAASGALLALILLGVTQPVNAQQTPVPQETATESPARVTGAQALLGTFPRLTMFIEFETEPLEKVTHRPPPAPAALLASRCSRRARRRTWGTRHPTRIRNRSRRGLFRLARAAARAVTSVDFHGRTYYFRDSRCH